MPFEIPDSWAWCRLQTICSYIHRGKSPKYGSDKILPIIAQKCNQWTGIQTQKCLFADRTTIDKYAAEQYLRVGDIIINSTGTGTVGRTNYVFIDLFKDYPKFVADSHVTVVRTYSHIYSKYIYQFLKSPIIQTDIEAKCSGSTNQIELATKTIQSYLIPLPPFREQQKIVMEIEKFEPLIAEYDKLEQQATKLDDEIYDKLKKSILQYAIQGKLVPQDPNDEPASVLLERIRVEKKAKLGKKYVDSYIYKGDDNCYYEKIGETTTNISDEIPFDLPENWIWIRLGYVIDFSKSETVAANQIDQASWILDLEDIEKDSGRLLQKKNMDKVQSKSDKHRFYKGNVLYSKLRPYLNKVIVADDDGYCTTEILTFDFGPYIVAQYAQIYLMSPYFVNYAMAGSYGVKMPRIGSLRGNNALIPIPPYNIQKSIINQYNVISEKLKDEG